MRLLRKHTSPSAPAADVAAPHATWGIVATAGPAPVIKAPRASEARKVA
jgi:hypothetical protein